VQEVHQTFLNGAQERIESMDVRFVTVDVAIATVTHVSSPFTSPDGTSHHLQRGIRTFVVANRAGRWEIVQDHNTAVSEPSR
jgi:hypothetical protein